MRTSKLPIIYNKCRTQKLHHKSILWTLSNKNSHIPYSKFKKSRFFLPMKLFFTLKISNSNLFCQIWCINMQPHATIGEKRWMRMTLWFASLCDAVLWLYCLLPSICECSAYVYCTACAKVLGVFPNFENICSLINISKPLKSQPIIFLIYMNLQNEILQNNIMPIQQRLQK